jgi:hypothetical protein
MGDSRAATIHSLVTASLRRQLDEIRREVGTPVVSAKATCADPVLYGGRGERPPRATVGFLLPRLEERLGARARAATGNVHGGRA